MKKTVKTQFAISESADFENSTWTFEMPENHIVCAGEFAIVDRTLYNNLMQSAEDLSAYCQKCGVDFVHLAKINMALKQLKGIE